MCTKPLSPLDDLTAYIIKEAKLLRLADHPKFGNEREVGVPRNVSTKKAIGLGTLVQLQI